MERPGDMVMTETRSVEVDSAGVRVYFRRAFSESPEIEVKDDLIEKEQLIFGEVNERFFEVRLPGDRKRQEIHFKFRNKI